MRICSPEYKTFLLSYFQVLYELEYRYENEDYCEKVLMWEITFSYSGIALWSVPTEVVEKRAREVESLKLAATSEVSFYPPLQ